jgi:chemotaxis family two-component system response regulator Rcp1
MDESKMKSAEILLVEDSPSDAALTVEALKEGNFRNRLKRVKDGVEAMEYLRRQGEFADAARPDLILLDLNLPRKDGREVLGELKEDEDLRAIPVVVLTTSASELDITRSYELHANCFVTKPVDFAQFTEVVKTIENFWLSIVTLPQNLNNN